MLVLFFLDLDNFKLVNDTLGHPSGDVLLKTSARLCKLTRASDIVGRLGGDELQLLPIIFNIQWMQVSSPKTS